MIGAHPLGGRCALHAPSAGIIPCSHTKGWILTSPPVEGEASSHPREQVESMAPSIQGSTGRRAPTIKGNPLGPYSYTCAPAH